MRASMSIPGAIAPVELDGHLLVDGGIADNLPIDEARKLCGDVVIAVNISTPPLTRDEITSAVSVSLQLVNLLGKENVDRQLESLGPRDVLIAPELGDISSGSFARAKDAIRIGEEAARAAAPALSRYSLPPAAYAEFRARQVKEDEGLGTVDEIRFAGLERTKPEVLRSLVETKAGEPLSEDRIAADLRRIYGRGDFESVDYRIVQEPGKRVLVIEPKEKAWGPNYLRFGVGLATDFGADSAFNALVSYRRSWINRLGGEWLVEGQIGSDPGVFTELYQPVNPAGHFFLAPYAGFQRTQRGIYTESQRVADYMADDTRAGIDLGTPLGTWGEARTGLLWRRVNAKVETGSPVLPSLAEDTAGARVRVYDDTLDHAWFARSGQRGIFSAYVADKGLGSDRNYKRLEGDYTFAWSFGRHTFNMNLAGGTDLGSDMPPYESFTLGGPLHLSGYHINELAGRRMAFGRLMYYNRSLALPDLLGSGVYLGGSIEAGWVRDRFGLPDMGTAKSASIFLGAQTFLGPAYFGLGFAPGGRSMVYLLLGVP
jgi:NTE family protein